MQIDTQRRVAPAELVRTLVPQEETQSLMRRNNSQASWHMLGHVLVLVTCGYLVALAQASWLVWPAMFVMGIVMTHLFAPQHECGHFSAFQSRRLNSVVAWACGAVIMVPHVHFRYEHHHHHTFTSLQGQDPQLIPMPQSLWAYLWYLSALPYWWENWSGIGRRSLGRLTKEELSFIPARARSTVIREARVLGFLYVALLAMVFAGWSAPLTYWILPLLLGQPVMRFIRMTEHVGRPLVADMLQNTRCTRVAAPWRLLAWNMNFHAEHHLLPSVPYHALPRFHSLIEAHIPVCKGYRQGHREILAQLRARPAMTPEEHPS